MLSTPSRNGFCRHIEHIPRYSSKTCRAGKDKPRSIPDKRARKVSQEEKHGYPQAYTFFLEQIPAQRRCGHLPNTLGIRNTYDTEIHPLSPHLKNLRLIAQKIVSLLSMLHFSCTFVYGREFEQSFYVYDRKKSPILSSRDSSIYRRQPYR